jgi:hypothetical protein
MACALVSVLGFGWISTGGTGQLLGSESFTDFYDHQAISLLKGRLDVPFEAIGFESFVHDRKSHSCTTGKIMATLARRRLCSASLSCFWEQVSVG